MMEKFCLQCGAELKMIAVPLNPDNAGSPSVAACSACGSQKYDTPNGVGVDRMKSQEALTKAGLSCEACEGYVFRGIELLTAQRDELLAALKEVSSSVLKYNDWVDECTEEAEERGDEGVSLSYIASDTEVALINENYIKALKKLHEYDHA